MEGKISVLGTIKTLGVGEIFVFKPEQIKYTSLLCACSKLRMDNKRVRYSVKTLPSGKYQVTSIS